MESERLAGLIMGGIAVGGSLLVGAISIMVAVPWSFREKLAKLEAANKERMAMIEKGVDPALLMQPKKTVGNDPLFWGILLIGLGLGSLVGILTNALTGWNNQNVTNAFAILFTGIAVVVYLVYRKRADAKKAD